MRSSRRPCALCGILFAGVALYGADALAGVNLSDIRSIQAQTQGMLETARTGTSRNWRNEATGAKGTVRVISTEYVPGTQPCRRYEWTIVADDGERMRATGEGCRTNDLTWRLDENIIRSAAVRPRTAPPAPAPAPPRREPAVDRARSIADKAPAAAPAPKRAERSTDGARATDSAAPIDALEGLVFTRPPRSAVKPTDGG